MTVSASLLQAVRDAIEPLPTMSGGGAVIVAVESSPPAMAMLATGSVYLEGDVIRFVVEAASSVARARPPGATLLVCGEQTALRVSVTPVAVAVHGDVAVLEGPVVAVRPSVELPWMLDLSFVPTGADGGEAYIEYWRACRDWLADPEAGSPPSRPHA